VSRDRRNGLLNFFILGQRASKNAARPSFSRKVTEDCHVGEGEAMAFVVAGQEVLSAVLILHAAGVERRRRPSSRLISF
jgi:hypothetical protein